MSNLWNAHVLDSMFGLPATAPILEKALRPILVYLFLVVLLRVFGKRELAQLNPFDLVVLLSLANTVQNAIIGRDDSLIGGMIGASSLCAFNYVIVRFMFKHRRLDQFFEGMPTVLIDTGTIRPEGLAKEMLSEIELTTMAHRQGFASLDEIESCILEPGGSFFIQGKQPLGDDRRHSEMMARIDVLSRQVEDLRAALAPRVEPQT